MRGNLPNDDELQRLYETERLSMQQIGKRFGVTRQRVHRRLKDAGVRSRFPIFIDQKTLGHLYIERGLPKEKVAKLLDVDVGIVNRELKRHGLMRTEENDPRRIDGELLYNLYVVEGLDQRQVAKKVGLSLNVIRAEIKRHNIVFRHKPGMRRELFGRAELYDLYVTQGLSCSEIGRRIHANKRTVGIWLRRIGITIRPGGRPPRKRGTERRSSLGSHRFKPDDVGRSRRAENGSKEC